MSALRLRRPKSENGLPAEPIPCGDCRRGSAHMSCQRRLVTRNGRRKAVIVRLRPKCRHSCQPWSVVPSSRWRRHHGRSVRTGPSIRQGGPHRRGAAATTRGPTEQAIRRRTGSSHGCQATGVTFHRFGSQQRRSTRRSTPGGTVRSKASTLTSVSTAS